MREKILELLTQRPFHPFRVHLSNGTVYVVRHPDQAMLGPGYVIIGTPVHDASGPDMSDVAFVSLVHVVEVKPMAATTPTTSN